MRKFLHYQIELVGTKEEDLTDDFVNKINKDFTNKEGIYNPMFGDTVSIDAHVKHGTLVLSGRIYAQTYRELHSLYQTFKALAKQEFKNCTKISKLLVIRGESII